MTRTQAGTVSPAQMGVPGHSRRLSDKILAAFNHAYAVGELDIATRLRAVLADVDSDEVQNFPDRRGADALGQAELWVRYVEARNLYQERSGRGQASDPEVLTAAQAMTEAFKRWSFS